MTVLSRLVALNVVNAPVDGVVAPMLVLLIGARLGFGYVPDNAPPAAPVGAPGIVFVICWAVRINDAVDGVVGEVPAE